MSNHGRVAAQAKQTVIQLYESFRTNKAVFGYTPLTNEMDSNGKESRYGWRYEHLNNIRASISRFICGIVLGVLLLWNLALTFQLRHTSQNNLQTDLTGIVPDMPLKQVLFQRVLGYVSDHQTPESVASTQENWVKLMPKGNGFISVKESSLLDRLPAPIESRNDTVYTLAVFHQLHCLYAIMDHVDSLRMGTVSTHSHRRRDTKHDWHIDHCFEYIQRSLMCCGDTTLEGQGQQESAGADGTGAIHLCRNYDSIVDWAESQRVSDVAFI